MDELEKSSEVQSSQPTDFISEEKGTLIAAELSYPSSYLQESEQQAEQIRKQQSAPPISPWRETLELFLQDWRTKASFIVLGFFVLLALAGPPIYQHIGTSYTSDIDNQTYSAAAMHNYSHEELDHQDELPSAQYWLGTDQLGRDILARLMQGMLISLAICISVAIVDFGLGLLIGLLAAYYGGIIDQLLARFTDLIFAFPGLLFLIMVAGIFGPVLDNAFNNVPIIGNGGGRALIIFLCLALFVWPSTARLVRGQALQIKQQQFIEAAHTAGTSNKGIIWRHITPNLLSIAIFSVVLDMVGTISGEAGISVLGIGIQPPGSSIGLMISDASPYVASHPWEIMVPTTALTLIVLAFAFLGDAFQDAFDPQGKKQKG